MNIYQCTPSLIETFVYSRQDDWVYIKIFISAQGLIYNELLKSIKIHI